MMGGAASCTLHRNGKMGPQHKKIPLFTCTVCRVKSECRRKYMKGLNREPVMGVKQPFADGKALAMMS